MKAIREAIDVKFDSFQRSTDEQLHTLSDEVKGGKHRTEEMIRSLNDEINAVEKGAHEIEKRLSKVISADIKLRKYAEKAFVERLENQEEKFAYSMQSFQTNIGQLSVKVTEMAEKVSIASI